MDCKSFRDRIFPFQADELPAAERANCVSHLDACPGCSARLALEDEALDALRAGLARATAPPGLETRIRSSLRATPARPSWHGAGWVAATVAVAVIAVAIVVYLPRHQALAQGVVTVVDLDCDRAGKDVPSQRGCRDPHHVNALKLPDGSYWTMDPTRPEFRYLLLDREQRGTKLIVAGHRLGRSNVIRLQSAERAALDRAAQGFMLAWNRSRIAVLSEVGIR